MKRQWGMIWVISVLAILAVARPVWAAAPPISIGALTQELVGQEVQVHGRVIDVAKPDISSYEFIIKDETGKITLRLPRQVYRSVPKRAWLNENAEVLATVRVGFDARGLYLQPLSSEDVTVLSPGSSAQLPIWPIKRLKGVGTIVAIEGLIIDRPPAPSGLLLDVADRTGSTTVRIPSSVLRFVPHPDRLVVGTPVRVVGRLEYQHHDLQVVPMLGEDVVIK